MVTTKADDTLSSQIDSLNCLLCKIRVNDREGFQTSLFKSTPFMSEAEATVESTTPSSLDTDAPDLSFYWAPPSTTDAMLESEQI